MKRKLLFALALLISGVCNLWAQTDVTSTYITNADFSGSKSEVSLSSPNTAVSTDRKIYQPEGWNLDIINKSKNNMTVVNTGDPQQSSMFTGTYAPTDGKYMVRFRDDQKSEYIDLSQTITINVSGVYTISADLIRENGSKVNVVVYAGDANASNSSAGTWQNCGFDATYIKDQEVKVGVKFTNLGAGGHKVGADNIKIEYKSNVNGPTLAALITNATRVNAILSDTELENAITTANNAYSGINNTPAYQATIDDAISNLRTAITTAYSNSPSWNHNDDLTAFISNADFETAPIFDGTSLGESGTDNATATSGSTLLSGAVNVYQITGWELMTTETSDYARIFTMPYDKTLYVQSNSAIAGQEVTSPSNSSSVTTSNNSLLFVQTSWCNTKVNGIQQTVTLPAGMYKMTFDTYVSTSLSNASSLCGISYGNTTNYKWPESLDTWTANEIVFTLSEESDVSFSLGYKKTAEQGAGSSAFLYVDNVKLTFLDPLQQAQNEWQAVHDALVALDATALPNEAENAITTELAKAVPMTTVDDVNAAKAALQALIDSYAGIKAAYESDKDFITAVTEIVANSAGDKTTINTAISTATTDIETRTTAADLAADYSTLEVACQTYLTSGAEPADGHPFEVTFKIVNPSFEDDKKETNSPQRWTIPNKGNQYGAKAKGSMSNVEGNYIFNNWQSWWMDCNVEQTISSLPNGRYKVTAVLASYSGTSANLQAGSGSTDMNMTGENNGIRVSVNGDVTGSSLTIRARAGRKNDGSLLRADDFTLSFIGLKPVLSDLITSATALTTTNVGEGAFQISPSAASTLSDAVTAAQTVYNDASKYGDDVQEAIGNLRSAIETFQGVALNAPADGARYRIKSTAATGASWKDKYYMLRPDASQTNGGYSTKADVSAADYLAIAWEFTAVTGGYTLSMTDADGATRYLCTNIKGYGQGTATQIRTTTDSEKALVVKVIAATGTDGRWFLQNTEDNSYLGGQDDGLFSNSQNYDLAIEEASQASVTVSCKADKYGTVIFPFVADITEFSGIKFYSCESVHPVSNRVQIEEVSALEANVPYLIQNEGAENFSQVVTGWGTATADPYTEGLLTGVYTNANINGDNRYVLQTPTEGDDAGVQAFYKVTSDFTATPYKCYLNYDASNPVKALFLGFNDADAIRSIDNESSMFNVESSKVYNLAGQRLQKLQKGINIVNGKKVLVK